MGLKREIMSLDDYLREKEREVAGIYLNRSFEETVAIRQTWIAEWNRSQCLFDCRTAQRENGLFSIKSVMHPEDLKDYVENESSLWLTIMEKDDDDDDDVNREKVDWLTLSEDCFLVICLMLPIEDLFKLMRVCKGWHGLLVHKYANRVWKRANIRSSRQWLLDPSPYSALIGVPFANPSVSAYRWRLAYQRGFAWNPAMLLGYALRCIEQLINITNSIDQLATTCRWTRCTILSLSTHARSLKTLYAKLLATGAEVVHSFIEKQVALRRSKKQRNVKADTEKSEKTRAEPNTGPDTDPDLVDEDVIAIDADLVEERFNNAMCDVYACETVASFSDGSDLLGRLKRSASETRKHVRSYIVENGFVEAFTTQQVLPTEDGDGHTRGDVTSTVLCEYDACLQDTVRFVRIQFVRSLWFPAPSRLHIIGALKSVPLRRKQRQTSFLNNLRRLYHPAVHHVIPMEISTSKGNKKMVLGKRNRVSGDIDAASRVSKKKKKTKTKTKQHSTFYTKLTERILKKP